MSDEAWEELEAAREAAALYEERSVTAAWLDEQNFPPLEWTVEGVLPEGMGLLVAPPKAGKSWMVANIGLACAAGGAALGKIAVKQRRVLYLALEDGHRRLQSRFRTLMEGQALPGELEVVTRASANEAMVIVDEFLRRNRDGAPLVIIDTLGKVKPPKSSYEDSYQADYRIGGALKRRIDDVPGGCLLLVHHTRKAESADFIDSVSGTQGIAGSADFVLVLARKRHAQTAILAVTGRDVHEAEYALTTEGGHWNLDGMDLMDAAATAAKRRDSGDLSDRTSEVLAFVNTRSLGTRASDVAEHLGIDSDTAGRYLRRLNDAGRITKRTRGLYIPVSEVSGVSERHHEADSSDTLSGSAADPSQLHYQQEYHQPDSSDSSDTPPAHDDTEDTE